MTTVAPPARQTMDAALARELDTLTRAGLRRVLRPVEHRRGAEVMLDGRMVVDFSSNDYLGLASDPRLGEAAQALLREGAGAAAARLLSGNHPVHMTLETELARFKGAERALLFSSGYTANIGTIPALVGKRDVIYADTLNHASLIDATRLSRAEVRTFPHCDLSELRRMLVEDAGKFRRALIAVDGVFSMDGDVFPLDQLVPLAREFGAWTYVDDAHATAVLGAHGRGSAEYCGVEGEIDVVMGTLSKALGTAGAFVAGSATLIEFLTNRARAFIFTTGTPPAWAAATLEALRIVRDEPWRRERLYENARRLRRGLAAIGWNVDGAEDAYVVPVVIGDTDETMRIGAVLREAGYLTGAVRPPTVPLGTSRLRLIVSAAHTEAHIDGLVRALQEALPHR